MRRKQRAPVPLNDATRAALAECQRSLLTGYRVEMRSVEGRGLGLRRYVSPVLSVGADGVPNRRLVRQEDADLFTDSGKAYVAGLGMSKRSGQKLYGIVKPVYGHREADKGLEL